MQTPDVEISKLKPNEYNPRRISDEDLAELKKSIEKFNVVEPLVVNRHPGRENVIIGGHQRYKICKEMGRQTVPVFFVDLNLEDEKELNLRLNRNQGEWDWDLMSAFDEKLLKGAGFGDDELNVFLKDFDLPDVNVQGELPETGDYVILAFDNEEQGRSFREKTGMKERDRTIDYDEFLSRWTLQ